jgi:hypothetical protein
VKSLLRAILVISLLVLSLGAASAQDQPIATEEPQPPPPVLQPTVPLPTAAAPDATTDPGLVPTTDPALVAPTTDPALAAPTAAPPAPLANDVLTILITARGDLELLANDRVGIERPVGWSGSTDINNPQLAILVRLDLEVLAGQLFTAETRPPGWFGAVPSTPFAIARDIRHDLELLADATIQPNVRPSGWVGDDPLYRCDRATQTLVALLERGGVFQLNLDPLATDYCLQAGVLASRFAEANLFNSPAPAGEAGSVTTISGTYIVNNSFTVGFFDLDARQRAGIIPNGDSFTPVARSSNPFSNMMLVRGNGFELFVDYATTSVTTDEFEALPSMDTVTPNPVCTAEWCG